MSFDFNELLNKFRANASLFGTAATKNITEDEAYIAQISTSTVDFHIQEIDGVEEIIESNRPDSIELLLKEKMSLNEPSNSKLVQLSANPLSRTQLILNLDSARVNQYCINIFDFLNLII